MVHLFLCEKIVQKGRSFNKHPKIGVPHPEEDII